MQMDSQIRQAELQRKQQEMQIDAAVKADELRIREQEANNRAQIDAARLDADTRKHRATLSAKQRSEGTRMGVDIAKSQEAARERRLAAQQNFARKGATSEE
jgi:hypothetical protein